MFSIFSIVALLSLIALPSLTTSQFRNRGQSQYVKLEMSRTQYHSLLKESRKFCQVTRKIPTLFLQKPQAGNPTGLDSGIVYDTKGHIITNNQLIGNAKIADVNFH
ncbi:MAG TPA: hypothetical protein VFI73_04300 [Candidatus Nitrosopolaris sp.]|nr:hypothetical protein [Candidatus Nitrosopolaris sp.]